MAVRTRSRLLVLVAAAALTGLPLYFAFAHPGDGKPFQQLQRQIDELTQRVGVLEAARSDQNDRIAALESLLMHFRRDGNDVTISGANLHVDNGAGRTDMQNGLGNVIVGYNEPRSESPDCRIFPDVCIDDRSGSHMFVAGRYHKYSSYGGIVAGSLNAVTGPFASVIGGRSNLASGDHAAVAGGSSNQASGFDAAVSGGSGNLATGSGAAVCGGAFNAASGLEASVSGGSLNDASGTHASVCGGTHNEASGELASIAGGVFNEAHGEVSCIGGGTNRFLATPYSWQAADVIRVDGPP